MTGDGLVAKGDHSLADMVVDSAGRHHLITATKVKGEKHLLYRYGVKGPQATSFHFTQIALRTSKRHPHVEMLLSPSGRQVSAVIASCRGVWTAHTSITHRSMPTPVKAVSGPDQCGDETFLSVQNTVALTHGRLAVLVTRNALTDAIPSVFVGRPGRAFHAMKSQPAVDLRWRDALLVRDADTGDRLVIFTDGPNQQGSNDVDVRVTEAPKGATTWSDSTTVATVDDLYALGFDAAAADGHVTTAFSKYAAANSSPGTLLLEGAEGGVWGQPTAPDQIGPRDLSARIALTGDGDLSLAFTRCSTAHPKLHESQGVAYTEVRRAGSWGSLRQRSKLENLRTEWVLASAGASPIVGFHRYKSPTDVHSTLCVDLDAWSQ